MPTIQREKVLEAIRVLGFDPNRTVELHFSRDMVEVVTIDEAGDECANDLHVVDS